MAAVDVPVHRGLGGRVAGEFAARPIARKLAMIAARWTLVAGTVAVLVAMRQPLRPGSAAIVVGALTLVGFAGVGLAVRRARVTVEPGGVRWGWGWLGFRLERDRLRDVLVYQDAVALRPRRGSTWFLTERDWDRFDALVRAVERAGLPCERRERRAPLLARLQSYGRVLDGLLLIAVLGTTVLAIAAIAR